MAGAPFDSLPEYIVVSAGQARHQPLPAAQVMSSGLASLGMDREPWLSIETPLEALSDPWAVLRALRDTLEDGARLELRTSTAHGHALKERYISALLALTGFTLATRRRMPDGFAYLARKARLDAQALSCSVIVPCRNERDNIAPLVRRVPDIGPWSEVIFVDGDSTDGTVGAIEQCIAAHPERRIRLLHQGAGGGKAVAVFQGFDAAEGDVMMILDADMTVAPEDLPRFYLALSEGVARFANGTRFAFPMAPGAMPTLNKLGNRVFSRLFSWLISTSVSDTLCGTKALFREDWHRISSIRHVFGGHDPWGDFDLLLGAHEISLRIVDVPVRYGARMAGESKMQPLRHGAVLARSSAVAARRFKLRRPT